MSPTALFVLQWYAAVAECIVSLGIGTGTDEIRRVLIGREQTGA